MLLMRKREKIAGYYSTPNTWRLVEKLDYKRQLSHDLVIHYLQHEIYESVDREMKHILSASRTGFYAGLRFLFAEVTYLSHLYWGKNSYKPRKESAYVARFMRKFNILPPEYGVHYEVFRHGLMHTHHPKWLKKGNRVIGWYVSNVAKTTGFGVFIPEFAQQVKDAINNFISELKIEKAANKRTRLDKFFEGYISTAKVLTRKDLSKYARTDFSKVPFS